MDIKILQPHCLWTINLDRLPKRKVKGYPKLFIHNAGIVDGDDRKGTQSTIDAFSRVKRTDIKTEGKNTKACQTTFK